VFLDTRSPSDRAADGLDSSLMNDSFTISEVQSDTCVKEDAP